jgi:hypothetical protein
MSNLFHLALCIALLLVLLYEKAHHELLYICYGAESVLAALLLPPLLLPPLLLQLLLHQHPVLLLLLPLLLLQFRRPHLPWFGSLLAAAAAAAAAAPTRPHLCHELLHVLELHELVWLNASQYCWCCPFQTTYQELLHTCYCVGSLLLLQPPPGPPAP